jgi:hypothetical protein
MTKHLLFSAIAFLTLGAVRANCQTVTISGADLSNLTCSGDPGDAQYVAANGDVPALAQLSTPDSGLDGDSPAVKIKLTNVSPDISSFGPLVNFTASYDLYGTPTDGDPYWLTYLDDPSGGYVGVISFGGPDLNGSSLIHVFYDYADDPASSDTYFGDTLAQLDSTVYGDTTFGQLQVFETLIEIGDYDNGGSTIPASANIDAVTISVPEPGTWASMIGGIALLAAFCSVRRRLNPAWAKAAGAPIASRG